MFELARRNRIRSVALVSIMLALLVAIGYFAQEIMYPGSGHEGAIYALVTGSFLFLISYYTGGAILLSSIGAREIEKKDAPKLYNVVEEMVIASGLGAMPKIYVIESSAPNAFATGRAPHVSAVAVTEGLLNICSRDELQAVVAHEIAHIKNRDILFMTLLSVMVGTISLISNAVRRWFRSERQFTTRTAAATVGAMGVLRTSAVVAAFGIVLILLSPFAAKIVYFLASRTREYLADAGGAIFTRNPGALADALEKISQSAVSHTLPVPDVAQDMLIVGPALFESHPPVEQRIAVLRKLAGFGALNYEKYAAAFNQVTGRQPTFIPRSAFGNPAVQIAVPVAVASGMAAGAFRREALNAVKKKAGYKAFLCGCGATIKIPPNFVATETVKCPGCGRGLAQCTLTPLGCQ
jgi:heat shock protein HtpX